MNVEQLMESKVTGETKLNRENFPQCHFVHHKSHMTWHEPKLPQWEPSNYSAEQQHGLEDTEAEMEWQTADAA
jgi:hypothetical protein